MIISGDFIALSLAKGDFVPFEEYETPAVIWFNIKNIVALSAYEYHNRLVLDKEHMVELSDEAATNLIDLMREERDNKVRNIMEERKKKAAETLANNLSLKKIIKMCHDFGYENSEIASTLNISEQVVVNVLDNDRLMPIKEDE